MEEFSAVVQTFGNHEKDQLLSCSNLKQQMFNHPNLNQKDNRLYTTNNTTPTTSSSTSDKYKHPHQDSNSHLNECSPLTQTCFADSALTTIPNENRFVSMPSDGFQKITEANNFDNYLHATVSTTTNVQDDSNFNDIQQFRSTAAVDNSFAAKQHRLPNPSELHYDTFQKVNTNNFDKTTTTTTTVHCANNSTTTFLECNNDGKQHNNNKSANNYNNELNSNFSVPISNLESDSTNTDRISKNIQSAQLANPNLDLSIDSDSSSCDDLIDLEINEVEGLKAVRADRMRGGRNKFGPMYKRDRARKLQMMRQRQLALQAIRTTMGSTDVKGSMSPTAYQQPYPNMNIKQEIQIPQVSSLTQSPDSSPSPIAIALGQVHASPGTLSNNLSGSNGSSAASSANVHENLARNESSTCQDGAPVNLQHSSDSKICFDSSTNPSSTADSVNNVEPLRVSPMIREFVQSIDDREWQTQLFALLQKQSYNQVEVDLFELMCKVLDQNLFSQVDWARNTVFFKDLKVDDQMKLLQHSWSDMLVLDHLHQRIHNGLPDETQLNNGQVFNLLGLGLLGVPQLSDYFNELQNKLQDLKFDMGDYVCMKFLILLNPNVRGIVNKKTVLEGHENVQAALLDYTLTCYPSVTDKFSRLLNILPEIHAMAARGEEHLYLKHCAGSAPTQTLLMEMLHAKRKV
ncbi:nuclear hormone receptor FTZ-F1 isoform X3 [Episyrphus balteatus]|uniref:nuclear hormone receptor FTZ-F1 isoform X3 n=1 Tax=Episyrphus balteatus TaxID=286459 RepID=UPI00248673FC|nr:nuclear hormone receptor FTZ-F1 isoform X3 [Episyrphus balteatus]